MKMCLHSVSYSGTWGDQTFLGLKDFINKASELGYDCVELAGKRPHASPLDIGKEERHEIKEILSDKGMELSCIASYQDFAAFFEHMDMAYMEKELVYMKNILEMTHDMGGNLVRTYTGYFKDVISYRSQWESCVKGIKESAKMASDLDITIGVQNHSCIASAPDSLLDFISEVNEPNLKAVLDAPYIDNHSEALRETVLKYEGLIAHTHLTDFIRRKKFRYIPETVTFEENGMEMIAVPVGKGSTNYHEFIKTLSEIGYDGALSYEMCSPLVGGGSEQNLDRCARETLEYIKGILSTI